MMAHQIYEMNQVRLGLAASDNRWYTTCDTCSIIPFMMRFPEFEKLFSPL